MPLISREVKPAVTTGHPPRPLLGVPITKFSPHTGFAEYKTAVKRPAAAVIFLRPKTLKTAAAGLVAVWSRRGVDLMAGSDTPQHPSRFTADGGRRSCAPVRRLRAPADRQCRVLTTHRHAGTTHPPTADKSNVGTPAC